MSFNDTQYETSVGVRGTYGGAREHAENIVKTATEDPGVLLRAFQEEPTTALAALPGMASLVVFLLDELERAQAVAA